MPLFTSNSRQWTLRWVALAFVLAPACKSSGGAGADDGGATAACAPTALSRLDLLAGAPGGSATVDGTLTAAHFSDPRALARDDAGRLYVADDEAIRAIDLGAGSVTTLAGNTLAGHDDGVGATASFDTPSGLVFTAGELYVTDTENNTIRTVNLASAAVATVAGALDRGTADDTGTAARFAEPEGLALAPDGTLYIADTDNDTIRAMILASGAVTTIAGSPAAGGTTDASGAAARFNKPRALVRTDDGALFVTDDSNQSVRRIDPVSGAVTTLATFAATPTGLCPDGVDLLVSLDDHTVVRVHPDGSVVPFLGQSGSSGLVDGAGDAARFNFPAGMVSDGAGTIYLADEGNFVVRAIDLAGGGVRTVAGVISKGATDGDASSARFSAPQGIVAGTDFAYVADTGNATIRQVTLATGAVTTLAGRAQETGAADGAASDARFNQPQGLALDPDARVLYIADAGNRAIRRVDLASGVVGTLSLIAAPGEPLVRFDAPAGLAFDGGHLYVTDPNANTLTAIDVADGQASTLAGTLHEAGSVDGVGAAAMFSNPLGVASDGRGALYVADSYNHTLRHVDVATRAVTTVAGEPHIQGAGDGVGADAHFGYLSWVAVSGCDVYVSDSSNNVIRRVDASSGAVTTLIGDRLSGVRLGPLPAQLTLPSAVTVAPTGEVLLVSENAVLIAR